MLEETYGGGEDELLKRTRSHTHTHIHTPTQTRADEMGRGGNCRAAKEIGHGKPRTAWGEKGKRTEKEEC